ncbi:MAG: TatD family hydrolase [Patescibacteria group bacterium]|nr:TatD family hydrolase [Patescibacteria group bacterium]
MPLIDTHAHLNFQAFETDREEVIQRTLVSGKDNFEPLEAVVNVGANLDSSRKALQMAKENKKIFASVGVHPHHASQLYSGWLKEIESLALQPKVVALGEIGLDLHQYSSGIGDLEKQKEIFLTQVEVAKKIKKPVIFHCRNAWPDLLDILDYLKNPPKGVFHCFSGTRGQAKFLVESGFYLSFTGNITYKSAGNLREAVKEVPLERLMVETDCPYLPPEPFRGLRNEPLYVKIVASQIAEIKGLPLATVVDATTENARKLFKLD